MTYARSRLWIGMSAVGTVVVLSLVAVAAGWPSRWLPGAEAGWGASALGVLAVLGVHVLVLAPFDLFGGFLLPRRFGRGEGSFGRFAAGWLRGVVGQMTVLAAVALSLLACGRVGGSGLAVAGFAAWMVALIAAQGPIARWIGGIRLTRDPRLGSAREMLTRRGIRVGETRLVQACDRGFTGGVVGLPGQERLMLPVAWLEHLGVEGVAAQLARWNSVVEGGSRTRGLTLAASWNLLGFLLAMQLPGAGVVGIAELTTTILGSTLWSFVGLLVLPSLSRPAVLIADQAGVLRSEGTAVLEQTLQRLDHRQDDEPVRSRWVETIFHPLPSLKDRVQNLRAPEEQEVGAWNVARSALYLSWAGLGFLSRAVHCNNGRPELWVALPCD